MRWARMLVAFGWLLVCGYAAGYVIGRFPPIVLSDYVMVCCALAVLAFTGTTPVVLSVWSQPPAPAPSRLANRPSVNSRCYCITLAVDDTSWVTFLMQHAELEAPPRTSR